MKLQDEEYQERKESSSRATIELTSVVLSAPVGDTVWQTGQQMQRLLEGTVVNVRRSLLSGPSDGGVPGQGVLFAFHGREYQSSVLPPLGPVWT